jgi:outer membrane biogenesis lipoprotein LolB
VRARGETWELTDPESELSALLGWWLPVRSFSAWLLGFPDPNFAADTTIGPDDALQSLEQRRWSLNYESYRLADGVLVPRRIDLAHQDLELRVIVDRWQSISDN